MRFRHCCMVLVLLRFLAPPAHAENWPGFRGENAAGVSNEKKLPVHWSLTDNLAWKATIAGGGWSSPIVWGKQVFCTSTSAEGSSCHVVSIDSQSGRILWDVEVFNQKPTRKEGRNSYATPTPVTDGERVYAFFAEGGAVALTMDGKIVWTNQDVPYYSQHGLGSSPILYKDLLIMPFDWSSPTGELRQGWQIPWDKSFLLALDKSTGKVRYKAGRGESRIGHLTPRIVEVEGRPQLLSGAGDVIEAFNPETGSRIWWAFNGGEGVVPSPVVGDGMVFTSSGFPTQIGSTPIYSAIRAFKLGGSGDVTKSNLVWEEKRAVPMIPSFVFAEHMLFTVKEDGIAQCFEAATGKLLWKHRLEGTYASSPVAADGHVYFLSEEGTTTIIDLSREYHEVAANRLAGPCQASMAVSDGRLFIRSLTDLYCVSSAGN